MQLVISPHLDDAVLACGQWLAGHPGCTVLTLFAGVPADAGRLTDWDARSGFASAREAVAARRREDERALGLLRAQPRWLDFADGQYGPSVPIDALAAAVREVLIETSPSLLLCPMGLFHADHRLAHDAVVAAVRGLGIERLRFYEDVPYRAMPGVLQARLAEWAAAGVQVTPAAEQPRGGIGPKARALRLYASQRRAFGGGWPDAALPERHWRWSAGKDGRRADTAPGPAGLR